MAGACAEVLLPHSLSKAGREELDGYIRSIACVVEEQAFWIAGQPFSGYDEPADEDVRALTFAGWHPHTVLGFCAGCRGMVSEAYLAMLAARVAQMFNGVVALGGAISLPADDILLRREGRYRHDNADYLTADFLHQWIGHPKFRMPG